MGQLCYRVEHNERDTVTTAAIGMGLDRGFGSTIIRLRLVNMRVMTEVLFCRRLLVRAVRCRNRPGHL